jgi:hypothetical protein
VAGFGDVDGDGHLDVVTRGGTTFPGSFTVLAGDGAGGFTASDVPHVASCEPVDEPDNEQRCWPLEVVAVGDVDGDGHADVLVRSEAERSNPAIHWRREAIELRRADGSGGFGAPAELDVRDVGDQTAWRLVDVAGDDALDLVGVDMDIPAGAAVRVRTGDGTGGFGPEAISTPTYPVALGTPDDLAFADIDADGHHDMVLGGTCVIGSGEQLLRACVQAGWGDGSGAFIDFHRQILTDIQHDGFNGPAVTDADGDGRPDLVGGVRGSDLDGGSPATGALALVPVNDDRTLGPPTTQPAAPTIAVHLADFDGDGVHDILADTNHGDLDESDDWVRVMFGDGAGGFGDHHLLPNGSDDVADLDADGRPDVVRSTGGSVEVFLNRWDGRP